MGHKVYIEQHVLTCPEGHALNMLVCRPVEQTDPCSCIAVITPYRAERYQRDSEFFSAAGFAMVVVDSRGCGASSGQFEPFEHDGEDVRHVIRWIINQAWSNGRVGLYGGSYSGFVQWAACKEPVAGLKSLAPVAAVYPGVDFPVVNGLMYLYTSRWLAYVAQRAEDEAHYLDNGFWNHSLLRVSLSMPGDWIATAGTQATTLKRWVANLSNRLYWKELLPAQSRICKLDVPALFVTGTYDDDQRGTLGYYTQLSERQRARSLLVIGPWDHDGTRRPRASFGGLVHDSSSCLDLLELHIQWYRFTLDGGTPPTLCQSPILYYMAGSERWFECASLAYLSNRLLILHCASDRNLVEVPARGQALSMICSGEVSRIGNVMEYEPLYQGSCNLLEQAAGIAFTSTPWQQPLAICGVPSVTLYLRAEKCTDICVTLYLLLPDYTAIYLGASNLRIESQQSAETRQWRFDSFNLICRELPRFSQLRIVVSLSDPTLWLSNNNALSRVELHYGEHCPCTVNLPLQTIPTKDDGDAKDNE